MSSKVFNYHNPVKIVFGRDRINDLKKLVGSRRVLLLHSRYLVNSRLLSFVNCELKSLIINQINSVKPNPTFSDIEEYYNSCKNEDYDIIIAIGGGSVIDSAKAVSLRTKNYNETEEVIKNKQGKQVESIPIIAIPTTAGSGSEVTPWATIWDKKNKKKYSLQTNNLWPEYAILDPILTITKPAKLTLYSALDSLSHSFEAIWNIRSNILSNNYSRYAINTILENLSNLMNDLNNIELREKMMLSSLNAGLSFSNTQTSIAHALSYYITLNKDIVHGLACSFTLPYIIKFLREAEPHIYEDLSKQLGKNFYDRIIILFDELNISTNFNDYNIEANDAKLMLEAVLRNQRAGNFPFLSDFASFWEREWDIQ